MRGDIRHKGRAREQDRHKGIEALAHTSVEDYQTCGSADGRVELIWWNIDSKATLLCSSSIHLFIDSSVGRLNRLRTAMSLLTVCSAPLLAGKIIILFLCFLYFYSAFYSEGFSLKS